MLLPATCFPQRGDSFGKAGYVEGNGLLGRAERLGAENQLIFDKHTYFKYFIVKITSSAFQFMDGYEQWVA